MFSIIRSGLNAISQELDVVSNNIANAGTTAFKRSRAEFADVYSKAISEPSSETRGLGAIVLNTRKSFQQGALKSTGSALDLSISGQGLFVLSPEEGGSPKFTRDGSFSLNNSGDLVTMEGFHVAGYPGAGPEYGQTALPLNIPLRVTDTDGTEKSISRINVDSQGIIEVTYGLNSRVTIGKIAMARFVNETELQSEGGNIYSSTPRSGNLILGQALVGQFGEIKAGALESSNTDITKELVSLIRAQQAFSGNARMMQADVEVTRRLIG